MKTLKFLHRWLGVLAAIFILLFATSGIILNHRSFFSGIDINRRYIPGNYQYRNWNLAALKSGTFIGQDSLLIYGNMGIWLTDSAFSSYTSFFDGIRRGADNRRTHSIIKTDDGKVFAGTMSGLYLLNGNYWHAVNLPVKENRITGLTSSPDGLWIATRSHLLNLPVNENNPIREYPLPYPSGFKPQTSLFRALWVIHSGKILGTPGKLLVDAMGLVMIILSLTGIIWFIAPDLMKALKGKVNARKRFVRINRFSLKWHNLLGIWALMFLIILTLTGMFLRPPLLIPIIRKTFSAIKHTILAHPNPWYDKIRDIQFDRLSERFILSTSEGFYWYTAGSADSLERIPHAPPISVMGINVFEQPEDGVFITGSFSGIHRWVPSAMQVHDYITGQPVVPTRGMVNPFGSVPVAGYLNLGQNGEFILDYNAGIFSVKKHAQAPPMPEHIKSKMPMPLWNLALEVHTGRIYSFALGDFYILVIPVMGLFILVILISGGVLWIRNYRRKKRACSAAKMVFPI